MKKDKSKPWTAEEHDFISRYGSQLTMDELVERLGRSKGGIVNYCHIHKLVYKRSEKAGTPWTLDELTFLRKNEGRYNMDELVVLLGRTEDSIVCYLHSKDIKYKKRLSKTQNPWDQNDLIYLKEVYGTVLVAEIAKQVGRSNAAVRCKAAKMGLTKDYVYTEEEIQIIKDFHGKATHKEIAEMIGKSSPGIARQVRLLGVSKELYDWTYERDMKVKELYDAGWTYKQIADHMEAPLGSIHKRLRLNDAIKSDVVPYTQKDILFIQKNYKTMTRKQIGDKLGRTPASIGQKAIQLGLTEKMYYWSEEEDAYIEKYHKIRTYKEIAEHLGVTEEVIQRRVSYKGWATPLKRFTPEEDQHIIDNITKKRLMDIARDLDRVPVSVRRRSMMLGVYDQRVRDRKTVVWTPEEIEHLKRFHGTKTQAVLRQELNKSSGTLVRKIKELGLKKR